MLVESSRFFLTKSDYLNILSSQSLETAVGYLSDKFLATDIGRLAEPHRMDLRSLYIAIDQGYSRVVGDLLDGAGVGRAAARRILWLLAAPDLYLSLNALSTNVKPPLLTSPLPAVLPGNLDPGRLQELKKSLPRELHGMINEYIDKKNVSLQQLVKTLDALAQGFEKVKGYELGVLTGLLHDLLVIKVCIGVADVRPLQPRAFSLSPEDLYEGCGRGVSELIPILSRARPAAGVFASVLSDALRFSPGVEALDLATYTGASHLASLVLKGSEPETVARLLLKLLGQYVLLKLSLTVVHSGLYRQEAVQFVNRWVG